VTQTVFSLFLSFSLSLPRSWRNLRAVHVASDILQLAAGGPASPAISRSLWRARARAPARQGRRSIDEDYMCSCLPSDRKIRWIRAWNTISRQHPATWPRRHVCSCCRSSSSWDRHTPCPVDSAVRGLVFLDRHCPASLPRSVFAVRCVCVYVYMCVCDEIRFSFDHLRERPRIPFSRREKEREKEREDS